MTTTISLQGELLVITNSDGTRNYLPTGALSITTRKQGLFPDIRQNLIELNAGGKTISIGLAELTSIGGTAPAATLADVPVQIFNLIAQRPANAAVRNTRRDIATILATEGEGANTAKDFSGSYTSGTLNVGPTSSGVWAGRAFQTETISLYCSERAKLYFTTGNYAGTPTMVPTGSGGFRGWLPANQLHSYNSTQMLRDGQIAFAMQVNGMTKDGVAAGTAIPFDLTYNVSGRQITDDLNLSADFMIDVIGDSIGAGSGMTIKSDMWAFQLRNYYRAMGYNVRLRNWSVSGSVTSQHQVSSLLGRYNFNESGLTVIALGMNDALNGLSTTADALGKLLTAMQAQNPYRRKLVMGVTPAARTASPAADQTAIAGVTAAIQATVAGFNSPMVQYVPGVATAFPVNTTFLQADMIHPTIAGQAAIFSALKSHLDNPANKCFELLY